jgi:hypothetical protein
MTAKAAEKTDPIADIRRNLIANGYRYVPVKGKGPRIQRWQHFRQDPAQIDGVLRRYHDHTNTGLLCGELVAIDVDVPESDTNSMIRQLVLALPGAERALVRTGKAPKAIFVFRATEPRAKIATAEYFVSGQKCQVEVLGMGQQFVGFGIHPETGQPYTWADRSPLDVSLNDLPEIAPDAVERLMADADKILAACGAPAAGFKTAEPPKREGGITFWQRVNTAALADADCWVTNLFPFARLETGTGAWRVTSEELGRALEEDISIHPDGAQDFGEEKPTTPIQLVIDYGGAATPKDAAFWLCEKMRRDPAEFGWTTTRPVSLRFGSNTPPPEPANDDDVDFIPQQTDTSAGLPEALCYPPGAVGEFARFITSCARFPSPHLALVSALALTAGMVGRRYKGPTGLRTNVYMVGLAESGFGKDVTIRAAEALADSTPHGSKVSQAIFADKLRSLPGLAGRLKKSPSCIAVIDEFGKFLALHAGKNVAPHREEITTALMELTGAPQGTWGGQEKAAGTIPRIVQPCLTVHGISTPATFWSALSSGNISEGLLGRLIVIDAGEAAPRKVRRPDGDLDSVPADVSEKVSELLGGGGGQYGGGPFFALNADSDHKPFPMIAVEFALGVEDLFEEFDDRMRAKRDSFDPQYRPILNRVGENAAKLALIVAIGCDPKTPVITREVQEWANAVAEASFNTLIRGAHDNIADNALSAEYLRVRMMVERSKEKGVTRGTLVKRLRGSIDGRRLDDILGSLMDAGEIRYGEQTAGSGQKRSRFWSAASFPVEATSSKPDE